MTPSAAEVIDPIFEYVIDMMKDIREGRRRSRDEARSAIAKYLAAAESKLGADPDFDLIKYFLVAWVDELCVAESVHRDPDWAREWREDVLEVDYFQTRDANQEFFRRAEKAEHLANKDALEVSFLCVVLGFRGMYAPRAEDSAADAARIELGLFRWIERVSVLLARDLATPRDELPWRPSRPLTAKSGFALNLFLAAILAMLACAGWMWHVFS